MNQSNVLTRSARQIIVSLILCVSALVSASAQTPTVSVDVKDVTVKELLQQIEKSSSYTFAYIDSSIDTDKRVTIKADNRSISSIIAEAIPGVEAEVKGTQIVLKKADRKIAQQTQAATSRTVTGRVTDENGEPVISAGVVLDGTTNGVITDFDGRYSIDIRQDNAVLVFSALGYSSASVKLSDTQVKANVVMANEAISLDDVVVVGYGVQNKRDVTTSIVSMKSDDFKALPTADFRDAMAAKMPGVQVLSLGGQPDGNVSIRVRGIQSATSGNEPLYVIDGVPCDARAFANLESNDIESLEVLKDASAAAIYGSRGSCGVILVTTKRGDGESKPRISYDGQFSISNVSKKIEMLDAYEWAQIYKESRDGSYLYNVPTGSIGDDYAGRPQTYHRVNPIITSYLMDETGTLTDTDWQDQIFRTAFTSKNSLSVSGGTKDTRYYIGANHLYREGTIIGSDFQRMSLRANVDGKKGIVKYGVSFSPSYSKTNFIETETQYGGDGVIATALMAPPIFAPYKEDGTYNWDMNGILRIDPWDTQCNEVLNPVALALEIDDVREKINVMGNAYVALELMKGLEYKFTAGGDFYQYIRNYYRPSYIPLRGKNYIDALSDPTAKHNQNAYFHWTLSNQLSFNRKFGDHSINAVAVYEAEKQTVQTAAIVGTGVKGDDKIRTTKGKTIDLDNTFNNKYAYTFASWFLRAQYSYKGRYMVSASIRGDGSSRFAPDTRWGYFPAASLGWRISDESFMDGARFIDDMKIRASVGQTGNAQIGNAEYLALYKTSSLDMGNGNVQQVYPSQIANNLLGWEKNTQYNAGVDVKMWQGLLGITADYYYSRTTDMLFDVPVSAVSGLTSSNVNIGSMQNQGVEISLSSHKTIGDFSYNITANWSLNRNKVLSLGDENADIIKESSYAGGYYITRVGQPVGCYYLMVQDGIFHNQEELDSYPHFETTQIGDFRFVDANGNGILEKDNDRVIVGNYMPDFYYGFTIDLGYKGFDLAANFQGVYGNEILNLERRYLLNMEASSNMMKESLQRFPYGELNRATRKPTGNNGSCTSTFHLEDGSYLRLQNLSLGYTFPNRWLQKAHISNLRLYVQANNLFTWTAYSGYNPEVSNHSTDALRPGEDYCSYPLSRTFSFGLSFNL